MRTSLTAIVFTMAAACGAQAEAPLSAIDWLSDSIATPVAVRPGTAAALSPGAAFPHVTTVPLRDQVPDGVGLISADAAGLPADLWARSTSAELAALLRAEPREMPPSLRRLLKRILVAELDPPSDADKSGELLLARVDKLLSLGALDEAAALLDLTGKATPELFRRRFDVALLTGSESRACAELVADPRISPTYPARIFCLARSGDWHTAAVTLETANALGLLDDEEDTLLARFLHPELNETADPLRPPLRPSPLIFRLYEAIGERLPTSTLPVAFAHADLHPTSGWKAQLDAAERLAKIGAIDPNRLMGLYTERRPAASGGIWDRAAAIQALDRAIAAGRTDEVSSALNVAWTRLADVGLGPQLAQLFAGRLPKSELSPDAQRLAFQMTLLTNEYASAIADHAGATAVDRFLEALASGNPGQGPAPTALHQAIAEGFASGGYPDRLEPLISTGREGEALLRGLALFALGAAGNYDDVRDAIMLMRQLGLDETARRASMELIVLESPL